MNRPHICSKAVTCRSSAAGLGWWLNTFVLGMDAFQPKAVGIALLRSPLDAHRCAPSARPARVLLGISQPRRSCDKVAVDNSG